MPRRRHVPEDEPPRPARGRSWSNRLAWCTLFGGGLLLVTRLSVATVVEIHGDGMAPTLVDGDHVVLLRESPSLERGDIVVYNPADALGAGPERNETLSMPPTGDDDAPGFPDARRAPRGDLRNTAVVDPDELRDNWERVKQKSASNGDAESAPLRLGRILARPGDRVTFFVPDGALGLAVEGEAVLHKTAAPIRINLVEQDVSGLALRDLAYESTPARRYPVLLGAEPDPEGWQGLALPPPTDGPVEIDAPGYLVVADNRDGGACCDSRALGWIPADAIAGKVALRLPGDPSATPDLDPSARGLLWKP